MKTTLIVLIATLALGVVLGPLAMESLQASPATDAALVATPQDASAAPTNNPPADESGDRQGDNEDDEEDENDEDEDDK